MLFDLKNDVGEYHNIYAGNPALGDAFYADMTNYLTSVGARIPMVPNPNYDPATYTNSDNYALMLETGPFIGTRDTQEDELGPTTFLNYWMDSWGVDIGAQTNDYDGDGIANRVEYAKGSDPTDAASSGFDPVLDRAGDRVVYRYENRNDDSGLTYTVQATTSLLTGTWTNVADSAAVLATDGALDENEIPLVPDRFQTYIRMDISKQ